MRKLRQQVQGEDLLAEVLHTQVPEPGSAEDVQEKGEKAMSKENVNLRIWERLFKTDPEQTKTFTRGGGFKGNAVRPMWCNQRMTEEFGPCGEGWGTDEPKFEVVNSGEEILVFCWVRLWYREGKDNTAAAAQTWGVCGDKVLIKDKNGLRSSDEAFKAAFTDALGNAMKFIGMAADIHLGLFDDSKYIEKVTEEYQEKKGIPKVIPLPEANKLKELAKSKDAESVKRLMAEMKIPRITATTVDQLEGFRTALEGL